MKRLISCILITALILCIPIFAASDSEQAAAEELYDLGLFKGTGNVGGKPVFELERTRTREEALVMLIRLLGKEKEALACDFACPYPDVSSWAKAYVGYAHITGLTLGLGDGTFGGKQETTSAQYLTFLLRALGYSTPVDFVWTDALTFATEKGLNKVSFADYKELLTRGNAAELSLQALSLKTKNGKKLLSEVQNAGTVGNGGGYTTSPYSAEGGSTKTTGNIVLRNEDDLPITAKKALSLESPVSIKANGEVQILIVHTHYNESYTPSDGLTYKKSSTAHTEDSERNMLRIGEIVTDYLNSRGIGTVQIRKEVDYASAYKKLRPTIEDYLEEYPNVQMVIDIHRDSFSNNNGTPCKTVATVNGQTVTQLMIVSGTGGNENWRQNLGFQARLHNMLENRYPGLMRPLILRDSSYNHDLTPASMILEVGTAGNELSEAMQSAYLFAETLADYLLGATE
ncbi:MAG: stage II sporulation protein P [Clostridia bacterium]|nr:stage II sporulation protein P [Clostridia bacterium]